MTPIILRTFSHPLLGLVVAVLSIGGFALPFGRAGLKWGVFATLFSAGIVQIWWSMMPAGIDPLVVSGHLAAGLGVFWAVFVWLMRRRSGEIGRLTSNHPGIQCGQFLCLAACLFTVLANLYAMVAQFAAALAHTWSYTVLRPAGVLSAQSQFPLDFMAVVLACLLITHATKSAYLLVPVFWVAFLAVARQCLLIPPVAPDAAVSASQLTGSASAWLLALLSASAAMLGTLVAVQGLSWKNSRRVAWRHDVAYLLRAPRTWPGLPQTVAGLGMFILAGGCLLLVYPAPAGLFRSAVPGTVFALAMLVASISVFTVANRHWRPGLGELAVGLMTLAICFAVLACAPGLPDALSDRFPLLFNALVLGCAVSMLFWLWLAGVWEQQLDGNGRPWTTAGRLVPVAKRASLMAGCFGVLFAFQMGIWPVQVQVHTFDHSIGRLIWGIGGLALLLVGVSVGYRRTHSRAFRTLITLDVVAIMLFALVRILPYTPYSY